ncbi:aldose 1-epimerase family protein [Salinibacterium sp. SWN167]|uniref:aldose 1-epimerase family protein n=1 Tax=Salinibacterium sp. SWN167 TaxID=2792054 RepID=UPI0018CF01B6|nr:aldose 1-epimerase family protein [Salinibacterium sp. SWN167]MBH0082678.1 aldose 1-epimerase family protein [Salinibacterium sp. SWN167]
MSTPTGTQYIISRDSEQGEARATITELAASLREFSIGGVDLVESYAETAMPPFADGIVLVPWPNRIEDGTWMLEGEPQHLDITERDRNNAIHGLLRNTGYSLIERTESSVTLEATVFPQHGYPFHLHTTVRYELVEGGLRVSHTATNLSDAAAPYALGTHPFFKIGDTPIAELTLTMTAATRFESNERNIPTNEVAVSGTGFDLSGGRLVGELDLDTAFGGIEVVDGVAARLTAPDGREIRVTVDDKFDFVQLFTPRNFPTLTGVGQVVAIEPMTAAPNAFNTGRGLLWLEPGAEFAASWGVEFWA